MNCILTQIFLLLISNSYQVLGVEDYWSSDFDSSKTCAEQSEVMELSKKAVSQCTDKAITNTDEEAFTACKLSLGGLLQTKCSYSGLKDAGVLLYCKTRGVITCCFRNESCKSWSNQKATMYTKASDYLTNKAAYLDSLVQLKGYSTCHHLDSLDASKCAKDCEKLENGEFAKNCTTNGGLFKCCIRRDRGSCHECRFCCTLPMCTTPPGGIDHTTFDSASDIMLKTHNNTISAGEIFFSTNYIYKNPDYFCLKPYSNKDPKKWHKYELEGFRKASDKDQLKKVRTFKYDNNLNNFVDPKVLKTFTKSEKIGRKIWRDTYGYQFTRQVPGYYSFKENKTVDLSPCLKKCVKFENSKFAKSCKKNNGLVKCCITFWRLQVFEETRNQLIEAGLIHDKPTKICKPKGKKDPCTYCSLNVFCSTKHPLTGRVTQKHPLDKKLSPEGNKPYNL